MTENNFRQSLASIFLVFALAFSLAGGLGISHSTRAQEASPSPTPATQAVNKIELHQALFDLTNTWTVMCVAAHPDDEDGTTLTVLRRNNERRADPGFRAILSWFEGLRLFEISGRSF